MFSNALNMRGSLKEVLFQAIKASNLIVTGEKKDLKEQKGRFDLIVYGGKETGQQRNMSLDLVGSEFFCMTDHGIVLTKGYRNLTKALWKTSHEGGLLLPRL